MISRLGITISAFFRRTAPDPFVLAILLTIVTAVLALTLGEIPLPAADDAQWSGIAELPAWLQEPAALLNMWRGDDGLWKFLAFAMQMCLILVTGYALAETRMVRRAIAVLARIPQGAASAAALIALVSCAAGLINWGLGLIVGALLAREVGRSLSGRGIAAHYPLLCAAGYLAMLVWHGGMSGSAPLSMTTAQGAAKVLPAASLAHFGNGVPLSETLFSPMNFFVSGGLLVGLPVIMALLAPKRREDVRTIAEFGAHANRQAASASENPGEDHDERGGALPEFLDRSPLLAWLLGLALLGAVALYVIHAGLGTLQLNEINAFMLGLGLILHGSSRSYMNAVADGARACAGIIVQFPLYAGIIVMLVASGLVRVFAEALVSGGNDATIPLMTFLSAGVVNFFVPSGGGQWGIQGPIALETGLRAGIEPGRMIMAVAYGDQLTNMLQPFWALPLLGICGIRARDIVGYTAIAMVLAGAWMMLGLLLF